jgi:chloride channel protein, CIC family
LGNMMNGVNWLKQQLSHRQFLVFCAIVVGLSAGAMAAVLKTLVQTVESLFHTEGVFSPMKTPYRVFLPMLGIGLTVLFVQKVLKGDLGKGVSNILYEIAKKSAFVKRHKLFSHVITSSLTVGLGGSSGLEAPIVITGSAVGSNIASSWGLSYRDRVLLLGCGAAAGIAAVFNSPIAGVMFAMEVLLIETTLSSFIPLIISAAVGALFSKIIFNEKMLFVFSLKEPFNYKNVPFYILLGFFCGFVALYYVRMSHAIGHFFQHMKINLYVKVVMGGLVLAILMYLFPPLFGEGYESIRLLADGKADDLLRNSIFSEHRFQDWAIIAFVGAIVFIKAIATSVTLSSGGNGGNFAPSLFVGSFTGFFFSKLLNTVFSLSIPLSNFTIVGMAGVLSGVFYAPLTSIFLIAEVTGGYELIIPLMIVTTLSSVFVRHFEPISLEVKNMIEKGEVFSEDKDRNILLLLKTLDIIETDFKTLQPNDSLRDLIMAIKQSKRNLFAVVDEKQHLVGILTLDDVRDVMFEMPLYDKIWVKNLMKAPPSVLFVNESMSEVMKKFDETQAWNLPVVDEGFYLGFISKSAIFSKYRGELMALNEELN